MFVILLYITIALWYGLFLSIYTNGHIRRNAKKRLIYGNNGYMSHSPPTQYQNIDRNQMTNISHFFFKLRPGAVQRGFQAQHSAALRLHCANTLSLWKCNLSAALESSAARDARPGSYLRSKRLVEWFIIL